MDLREKKTKRSIKNAFLLLRASKPLERITIRELAAKAEISKATFYLHYKDIYDLSASLQNEVIEEILASVLDPDVPLLDHTLLTRKLFEAFEQRDHLIGILFAGSQTSVLPDRIARIVQELVFASDSDAANDPLLRVSLTYQIYGSYYAYWENCRKVDSDRLLDLIDLISDSVKKVQMPKK